MEKIVWIFDKDGRRISATPEDAEQMIEHAGYSRTWPPGAVETKPAAVTGSSFIDPQKVTGEQPDNED